MDESAWAALSASAGFPFDGCVMDCGRCDGLGVDEAEEWRDWSNQETTTDQRRIEDVLEGLQTEDVLILHVGIGNSSLARRFASRVRLIHGITIQENEVRLAESLRIPNYRVLNANKYSDDLCVRLGREYDYIVDNNPSCFACCKKHFFTMLVSYRHLLKSGGRILTDRRGLGWSSTPNDTRWRLEYDHWANFGARLGLVPAQITEWVYSLGKPPM